MDAHRRGLFFTVVFFTVVFFAVLFFTVVFFAILFACRFLFLRFGMRMLLACSVVRLGRTLVLHAAAATFLHAGVSCVPRQKIRDKLRAHRRPKNRTRYNRKLYYLLYKTDVG